MNRQEGEPLTVAFENTTSVESREELSHLFAEHHRRVLAAAYRITGSLADAEDVTQSVFLRLATGQRAPATNVRSYLYRAAINGALDVLRRRKIDPADKLQDDAAMNIASHERSPESAVQGKQLGDLLRLAISELPPRAAEMFTLRYLEELGNPEIAKLMSTSQAVVAVTLHNARSRLKTRLKQLERGTI